jgi:hypothetical protein
VLLALGSSLAHGVADFLGGRWQAQREPAAGAGAGDVGQVASVFASDAAGDREAEAGAGCADGLESDESLEEPFALGGGNAGTVVADAGEQIDAVAADVDPHVPGWACRGDGVVDEVAQGAGERVGVAEHECPVFGLDLDGGAGPVSGGFGDGARRDGFEVGRPAGERLICLEAGQVEEVGDESAQAGGVAGYACLEGVRSGRSGCSRSRVSAVACSAAIGVRSSCDASARNRRIADSERWARAIDFSSSSTSPTPPARRSSGR